MLTDPSDLRMICATEYSCMERRSDSISKWPQVLSSSLFWAALNQTLDNLFINMTWNNHDWCLHFLYESFLFIDNKRNLPPWTVSFYRIHTAIKANSWRIGAKGLSAIGPLITFYFALLIQRQRPAISSKHQCHDSITSLGQISLKNHH